MLAFRKILCTFYRMNPKSIFSYDSFRAHATIFSILPSTLQQSKWHLLCHLFWMLQAHKMKFSVKDFEANVSKLAVSSYCLTLISQLSSISLIKYYSH